MFFTGRIQGVESHIVPRMGMGRNPTTDDAEMAHNEEN
jgi:hypothetical protein